MASYRILVTGSRDWINEAGMASSLKAAANNNVYGFPVVLVHGTARGADRMAAAIAHQWGWKVEAHPAQWENYGKRAGFVRNAEMVKLGADICVAFIRNNSKGATMCAEIAEKANIPTVRVYVND